MKSEQLIPSAARIVAYSFCVLHFAFCLLLFCPAVLAAQEPPVAGRPAQFSNVVGSYSIAIAAAPTEVPVEEPITLRVTIRGTGPAKFHPDRRHLKLFPEAWANDFFVEPAPDEDRLSPAEGTWVFVYRLRPKHQQVALIEGIKLIYYRPGASGAPGKFQTARADETISIKVTPRLERVVAADLPVRTAPASFYDLPDSAAVLAPSPPALAVPLWLLLVVLVSPLLLTLVGVLCRRAWAPESAGESRRKRSSAAVRAIQALQTAANEPVWDIVGRYLRQRLDFPGEEPTPAEVCRFLRQRGASRAVAEKFAGLLVSCDAARFAGGAWAADSSLPEEAIRLIDALEDDLCG